MESNAIETTRERPAAEHGEQQSEALLFSDTGQSICYWGAMVLLAVASAYLIYSQFAHPSVYARPASDPLGIVTPPWLILPLAPLGAVGSLGHALWQALVGGNAGSGYWRPLPSLSCSQLAKSSQSAHRRKSLTVAYGLSRANSQFANPSRCPYDAIIRSFSQKRF